MPTLPTSADRAAEFNRLIVEQGHVTRSMKYGWKPDDAEREQIDRRATRLLELAELLPNVDAEPGRYVNDRIAAWLRANPLALTTQRVAEVIESKQRLDCGVSSGVVVSIGELGKGGYYYTAHADDLSWPHQLEIKVPESVAEHFRQQGRRALQAELRDLLNVSRA